MDEAREEHHKDSVLAFCRRQQIKTPTTSTAITYKYKDEQYVAHVIHVSPASDVKKTSVFLRDASTAECHWVSAGQVSRVTQNESRRHSLYCASEVYFCVLITFIDDQRAASGERGRVALQERRRDKRHVLLGKCIACVHWISNRGIDSLSSAPWGISSRRPDAVLVNVVYIAVG